MRSRGDVWAVADITQICGVRDGMTTDEELMVACGRGSDEAFAELFARYRQRVWGFFRRRLADRQRAEDLAQDVFVALLRAARRYEPRASFRAYLFGIAFRLLAAERRRGTGRALAMDLDAV